MKKAFVDRKLCAACGCCLSACRLGAIRIPKGIYAVIDEKTCIGCGMCAKKCPASVIEVKEASASEAE